MGTRHESSTWDPNRAMQCAVYETHRFCIRLPPYAAFVDDDAVINETLTDATLAVFVHEYVHFVHNVSTVVGWTAYELLLDILALFTRSLDEHARCDEKRLSADDRDSLARSLRAFAALEGARYLPEHPSRAVGLKVVDVVDREEPLDGLNVKLCDVEWKITRRDGSEQNASLSVGALLIEEGVAYLLETSVREGHLQSRTLSATMDDVPLFPYVAYQILCRHLAPSASPLAMARLGLIALNSNRPGAVLSGALRAYEVARSGGLDDNAACEKVRDALSATISDILTRIQGRNLDALPGIYVDRGVLHDGIKQVAKWFAEGLAERQRDIWFDLDWCASDPVDRSLLEARFRRQIPCDIIQERFGANDKPERDVLLTMAPHDLNGVRALQAQFDFLLGHLRSAGLASTVDGGGQPCPFFTSCTLKLRRDEPQICAAQPWTFWQRERSCWYGVAVAGSMGKLAIVIDDDSQNDETAKP